MGLYTIKHGAVSGACIIYLWVHAVLSVVFIALILKFPNRCWNPDQIFQNQIFQFEDTVVSVALFFWLSNVQLESASMWQNRKMILPIGQLTVFHASNQSDLSVLGITVRTTDAEAIYRIEIEHLSSRKGSDIGFWKCQ